jgi:hypothetical protein
MPVDAQASRSDSPPTITGVGAGLAATVWNEPPATKATKSENQKTGRMAPSKDVGCKGKVSNPCTGRRNRPCALVLHRSARCLLARPEPVSDVRSRRELRLAFTKSTRSQQATKPLRSTPTNPGAGASRCGCPRNGPPAAISSTSGPQLRSLGPRIRPCVPPLPPWRPGSSHHPSAPVQDLGDESLEVNRLSVFIPCSAGYYRERFLCSRQDLQFWPLSDPTQE